MNEPTGQSGADISSTALDGCLSQAAAETAATHPNASPENPTTGTGQPGASGSAPRAGLDPAIIAKTLGTVLEMAERSGQRSLYAAALKASSGDREFAAGIAAEWAWSPYDLASVQELLQQTVELYALQSFIRPDIALLLAVGTHAGGLLMLKASLRKRAAESAPVKPPTQKPPDAKA